MDGLPPVAAVRAMPADMAPAPPPGGRAGSWRRWVVLGVAALVVLGVAVPYGHRWWTDGRFTVTTDDAYLQADMVAVSARVPGQVAEVMVGDNQLVRQGDVMVRLDDRDLRTALQGARADVASAEADIASVAAQLRQQQSTVGALDADVVGADASAVFSKAEAARYADLVRTGTGSVQRAQQADADIRGRNAAATRARAEAAAARMQITVLQAQLGRDQASLLRARAAAEQAALNLSYATVAAPTDGAIGDRSVRAGQYVQAGTRMLNVVPMGDGLYVVANFKETQLTHVGAGEAVRVDVDMLAGGPLRGVVDSLAPGSGSTFALLPPENATGNFTKIVQRVPVRIRLLPDARLSQLRPGLSALATVDPRTAPPGPLRTQVAAQVVEPARP